MEFGLTKPSPIRLDQSIDQLLQPISRRWHQQITQLRAHQLLGVLGVRAVAVILLEMALVAQIAEDRYQHLHDVAARAVGAAPKNVDPNL